MWIFPVIFLALAVLAYHQGHYYMAVMKLALSIAAIVTNIAWGIPMNLKWLNESEKND